MNQVLCFANNFEFTKKKMIDYMNHYFSEIVGKKKGVYDNTVSLNEKNNILCGLLKDEINNMSGISFSSGISEQMLATNPNVQWAAMATINTLVDIVMPQVLLEGVGYYADVVTGDFGSGFSFDIKSNDLFVTSKAGRNQRNTELQRGFEGKVTLVPENHAITVGCNLYRILSGLDSIAEFVMKAITSIEASLRIESYNVLNNAMTALSTSPISGSLKVAGFTKKTAIELAQIVGAFNNGVKPVFIGTRAALSEMTADDAAFRYTEESSLFKLGYFLNYSGYDMIELEQVAKWNDKFKLALNDKKIFVLSPAVQKIVKICYEGSMRNLMRDSFEYANSQQIMTINKAWAMGVATNAVGGLIELA